MHFFSFLKKKITYRYKYKDINKPVNKRLQMQCLRIVLFARSHLSWESLELSQHKAGVAVGSKARCMLQLVGCTYCLVQ